MVGVIPSPNEVLDKYRNLVKECPSLEGFLKLDYLAYAKYQVYSVDGRQKLGRISEFAKQAKLANHTIYYCSAPDS